MNSAELIKRVRRRIFMTLGTHPDFDDLTILEELNDTMTTLFERAIVETRSGYWQQTLDVATTSGRASYRLPPRACAFEKLEIGMGAVPSLSPIHEVSESHAALFERAANQLGQPRAYVLRGDQIVLLPTPDNSAYTIRIYYYLRPSRLVLPQSTGVGGLGGTVRGTVTAVTLSSGGGTPDSVTVDAQPFNQELASPAVITFGTAPRLDIVHPDGWHELPVVSGVLSALVGTTINFVAGTFGPVGSGGSEVLVGDFVRVPEQTDWPCIPDDFHVCLADACAVRIMTSLNMAQKASMVASSVSADLTRFQSMIAARVKDEPKTIRAPLPMLRGRMSYPGRFG
jgi:hypothetical protein